MSADSGAGNDINNLAELRTIIDITLTDEPKVTLSVPEVAEFPLFDLA